MTQHKSCYGAMLYDCLHLFLNDQMRGKVFSFDLDCRPTSIWSF